MENQSISDYARLCAMYNLPISLNQIGDSGEKILGAVLSYFPFFRTYFLDGKAPVEDFICEIADEEKPYPFFIQVKTTEKERDERGHLLTTIPREKRIALSKRPIPTYLAGVDLHKIGVFLCPVFDPEMAYSTIPPTHLIELDDLDIWAKELQLLKEDVINYWENHTNSVSEKSTYISKL